MKKYLLCFIITFYLFSCSSAVRMTSSNMNKLALGMSKNKVTNILGTGYTIAEKRIENGVEIEILSYRNFYEDDEFYMFLFANDQLERWYRELLPKYETGK